jgi:hypothetical protein
MLAHHKFSNEILHYKHEISPKKINKSHILKPNLPDNVRCKKRENRFDLVKEPSKIGKR